MKTIYFDTPKHGALVDATVKANGYDTHGVTTGVGTAIHFTDEVSQATAQAIFDSVGAWLLGYDAAVLDAPIKVTGYNANANYTIVLDGEEIASGTDDSAPYELTFTPTVAGTYIITVIAANGARSGRVEIEVS